MNEGRYRVLVVDGNAADQEWLRRALSGGAQETFEATEARRGSIGLEAARAVPPDCIIVDHRLPDMDGMAFVTALRGERGDAPTAIVILTEHADGPVAVHAMRTGAHEYLVKGASPAEVRRAIRAAIERQARLRTSPYKVLIIDDSPEDRATYRRRLSKGPERFEFREAETGEDGMALARSFHPDCVLLDYQLPDMDGIEVVTTLLHERGHGNVAIIMLTGQGNETVAVRALKAGAEDYLAKGPGLESLPQAVRAAVEKVALRRRVDEQRRQIELHRNQLRVTLASIGDAVITTDRAGKVAFMNPVAETLTGWRSPAAQGRPLEEVFVIRNEETKKTVENSAERALREGVVLGLANHTVLIGNDGMERPIDDSAAPIRGESGETLGAVLVFRDVTERRRNEQSLLLQSRVLESMTEGVSVANESGVIFYTNPAEERMFGYERGELLGKHVTILNDYSPEENHRRMDNVLQQLKAGGTWTGEWHNRRKDGTTFTTYARITTLQTPSGTSFVCVQEDVSDRRRLEDELQRRVAELALADKRKDEFLAMLAHELRNPLAPLKNAVHVLKLRSGDWKTVDQVREMMERQIGHMGRLVDDLLDVSRITQGKITLKFERLDLARLVREAVGDHQNAFWSAQLSLGMQVPETPVWVTGDATRLTQVLDNFLTNAQKFTNVGGEIMVTVSTDGGHARLSVRDNGIGIEADVLPLIFHVFAQADKSLARSRGGLGLGLAIVKGLVELHGGQVWARSEGLGQGTEMVVELPLEQELPALAPASGPLRRPGGRHRILVIEDNNDAAESLRLLLDVSGYDVKLAHTGPDGVHAALDWRPDVVICDIGLPGMDGFAVARQLRQNSTIQHVRLIAVTGYGREEDAIKAKAAGFDDYLIKPADPERLLSKLDG